MQRRRDNDGGIELSKRASIAFNTLVSTDRSRVRRAIESLQHSPDDPYIKRMVKSNKRKLFHN